MSAGAFRDASAALERAAMLEEENAQLRLELDDLAKMRVQVEELEKLRAENDMLREAQRSENEGAFLKRLQEERVELSDEVRTLRLRLAEQEGELVRVKRRLKQEAAVGRAGGFFDTLERIFTKKRE